MSFNNKLDILYEDNSIIVCVKPSGVASQTERGFDPDMVSILMNHLASKDATPYVGVIHRLDKPVCGVMVYAKTKAAAAALSHSLATHSFSKNYYAIVYDKDNVLSESGTLKNFLLHDVKSNSSKVVDSSCDTNTMSEVKEAILEYKLVKRFSIDCADGLCLPLALLDIHLITGRHHQIRVQLSHIGCPILGDNKYGNSDIKLPFKSKRTGLALCAYDLTFPHPDKGDDMNFSTKPTHGLWGEVL